MVVTLLGQGAGSEFDISEQAQSQMRGRPAMSPRSHADTSFTNKTGSFDMQGANSDFKPNNSPARFIEVANETAEAF
jgi:hypothetical protein